MAKEGRSIRLLIKTMCTATALAALVSLLPTKPLHAASIDFAAKVTDLDEESAFFDPPEVGDVGTVNVGFSETDLVLREAGDSYAVYDLHGDWSAGIFTAGGEAAVEGVEAFGQSFSLEVSSGASDMLHIFGFDSIGETFELTAIDPLGIAFAGTDLSVVTEVLASLSSSTFSMGSFLVADDSGAGPAGVLLGMNGKPTNPMPEPGSTVLLGAGALLVGGLLRKSLRRDQHRASS